MANITTSDRTFSPDNGWQTWWATRVSRKPPSPLSFFSLDFSKTQVRKNSPNIKFLGGIFLGHPGPRRRDVPDKNFMQAAFFCCFRQGVAGMSRHLGRDVPDLEKLYARKLWADFSYPKNTRDFPRLVNPQNEEQAENTPKDQGSSQQEKYRGNKTTKEKKDRNVM